MACLKTGRWSAELAIRLQVELLRLTEPRSAEEVGDVRSPLLRLLRFFAAIDQRRRLAGPKK